MKSNTLKIEAVDIIKPEPLKPSPSNWRADLGEDWQKVNKKDKTDGMSQKAVDAYRRENPGSKLKTAVTGKVKKEVRVLREENHIVLVLKDK